MGTATAFLILQEDPMAQDRKIRLESTELSWLCDQVALIQKSGIPLPEGIDLLAESADLPRQANVLLGQPEQDIGLGNAQTDSTFRGHGSLGHLSALSGPHG
jgi:type II secretory pathway component PulF